MLPLTNGFAIRLGRNRSFWGHPAFLFLSALRLSSIQITLWISGNRLAYNLQFFSEAKYQNKIKKKKKTHQNQNKAEMVLNNESDRHQEYANFSQVELQWEERGHVKMAWGWILFF